MNNELNHYDASDIQVLGGNNGTKTDKRRRGRNIKKEI